MTHQSWDIAQSRTSYERAYEASQRALTLALRENRVRDECLAVAMGVLLEIATRPSLRNAAPSARKIAATALDKIEARMAQLEPEEEAAG